MMNYYLPLKGIAAIHCSANVGKVVMLQFSLDFREQENHFISDPKRALIGDDEHGWDDDGVFNFEEDVIPKCINQAKRMNPIFIMRLSDAYLKTIVRPDSSIDFADASKTEYQQLSYLS